MFFLLPSLKVVLCVQEVLTHCIHNLMYIIDQDFMDIQSLQNKYYIIITIILTTLFKHQGDI